MFICLIKTALVQLILCNERSCRAGKEETVSIDDVEHCEEVHSHKGVVLKVNREMPDEDELYDLAELFKVFGDSTRIKILFALFEEEMCVCDIAESLNMTQSAISHQLKILKQSKLVGNRREGKQIIYFLADDHVRTIIDQGLNHIEE